VGVETAKRKDYLRRLIGGLEQAIENMKFEIPYYKPDDLQLKYAKKFLASAEQNLKDARQELEQLLREHP
jgi:predicted nucleotide-binding protein